jgi:hypothetical protein
VNINQLLTTKRKRKEKLRCQLSLHFVVEFGLEVKLGDVSVCLCVFGYENLEVHGRWANGRAYSEPGHCDDSNVVGGGLREYETDIRETR